MVADVGVMGSGLRLEADGGVGPGREAPRGADETVVAIQRGGVLPSGGEQVRTPVRVAVEDRDAPAHVELPVAVVDLCEASWHGLLHKARWPDRRRRGAAHRYDEAEADGQRGAAPAGGGG